jgi:hypothetical protein
MMKIFALVALLGLAAAPVAAQEPAEQERPRVPDDSIELVVSGCLKGRVLAVSDARQTDVQSGPPVRSRSFRLAGSGDLMKDVKKEDGHFVEVTGIVKRSALDDQGARIGKRIAIGAGSPVAGRATIPEPAANVVVMDISSLRHRSTSCAVR